MTVANDKKVFMLIIFILNHIKMYHDFFRYRKGGLLFYYGDLYASTGNFIPHYCCDYTAGSIKMYNVFYCAGVVGGAELHYYYDSSVASHSYTVESIFGIGQSGSAMHKSMLC